MRQAPELSIVMPAHNEEVAVARSITSHLAMLDTLGTHSEIVVIDDGSTDATWRIVEAIASRDARVRATRRDQNRGIEPTLLELYESARGEWIYYVPGDDQLPPEALRILWSARDGVVCVVGRRFPRMDPWFRRIIAGIYSLVIRAVFQIPVRDIDSTKLVRANVLRAIGITSRSTFAEAELLIRMYRAGLPLRELTIPHRRRLGGSARGASPRVVLETMRDLVRFAVTGQ